MSSKMCLRKLFELIDASCVDDDKITKMELVRFYETYKKGNENAAEEVNKYFDDGEESMNFDQFVAKFNRNASQKSPSEVTDGELKKLFDQYDTTKDGKLDRNEVTKMLLTAYDNLSTDVVDEEMKKYDASGDKVIDFEEFKNVVRNLSH